MRHSNGLKTDRSFYEHNGKPYEFVGYSEDKAVLSPMTGNDTLLIVKKETFIDNFNPITQGELFDFINNDDDDEHAAMMSRIGVGYICPFCGGRLGWESDFMASEVRGFVGGYVKLEHRESILFAMDMMDRHPESGWCGVTEDIEAVNAEVERTGEYEYMYMREDKKDADGNIKSTWWCIDDPVVGIYRCMNCGKNYEIMDCPASEEHEYPYFQ